MSLWKKCSKTSSTCEIFPKCGQGGTFDEYSSRRPQSAMYTLVNQYDDRRRLPQGDWKDVHIHPLTTLGSATSSQEGVHFLFFWNGCNTIAIPLNTVQSNPRAGVVRETGVTDQILRIFQNLAQLTSGLAWVLYKSFSVTIRDVITIWGDEWQFLCQKSAESWPLWLRSVPHISYRS